MPWRAIQPNSSDGGNVPPSKQSASSYWPRLGSRNQGVGNVTSNIAAVVEPIPIDKTSIFTDLIADEKTKALIDKIYIRFKNNVPILINNSFRSDFSTIDKTGKKLKGKIAMTFYLNDKLVSYLSYLDKYILYDKTKALNLTAINAYIIKETTDFCVFKNNINYVKTEISKQLNSLSQRISKIQTKMSKANNLKNQLPYNKMVSIINVDGTKDLISMTDTFEKPHFHFLNRLKSFLKDGDVYNISVGQSQTKYDVRLRELLTPVKKDVLTEIIISKAKLLRQFGLDEDTDDIYKDLKPIQKTIITDISKALSKVCFNSISDDEYKNPLNNFGYYTSITSNAAYVLNVLLSSLGKSFRSKFKSVIDLLTVSAHDLTLLKTGFKNVFSIYDSLMKENSLTYFLGCETIFGFNVMSNTNISEVNADITEWCSKKPEPEIQLTLDGIKNVLPFKDSFSTKIKYGWYYSDNFNSAGAAPGYKIFNEESKKYERASKAQMFTDLDYDLKDYFLNKTYIEKKYEIRTALKLEQIKTRHIVSTDYHSYMVFSLINSLLFDLISEKQFEMYGWAPISTISSPKVLSSTLNKIFEKKFKITLDYESMDHYIRKDHILKVLNYLIDEFLARLHKNDDLTKVLTDIKLEFLQNYFDNLECVLPEGTKRVKYGDGMLSGIKITNIVESLISYCIWFDVAVNDLKIPLSKVLQLPVNITGDDFAGGSDSFIDIDKLRNGYLKRGYKLNKDKTRLSLTGFDYLRHVFFDNLCISYPFRAITGILYNKPWNEVKNLGPYEYFTNLNDVAHRFSLPLVSTTFAKLALGPLFNMRIFKYLKGNLLITAKQLKNTLTSKHLVKIPKQWISFSKNLNLRTLHKSLATADPNFEVINVEFTPTKTELMTSHKDITYYVSLILNQINGDSISSVVLNSLSRAKMSVETFHRKRVGLDAAFNSIYLTLSKSRQTKVMSNLPVEYKNNVELLEHVLHIAANDCNFRIPIFQKYLRLATDEISSVSNIWGQVRAIKSTGDTLQKVSSFIAEMDERRSTLFKLNKAKIQLFLSVIKNPFSKDRFIYI